MGKEKVLIFGASGTVGSEIVKILKNKGVETLLATSKEVSKSDTNKVHVNLTTGEGIKQAMEKADKAFVLSPPGYSNQYALLSPVIQEAKRRGLKKVVLMTAMGANASEDTPFRKAEIELEKSGLQYNIIRPNWFMQNFNTFWVHGINTQNKILLPAGKAKVSFIDARDIAEVAATLLTTDKYNNKDFDLTGPEAVNHSQVATAISTQANRKIVYQETPPDEFKKGLISGGVPEDYANFLLMIFGFLREGYSERTTQSVNEILGRKPRGITQYVADYKSAWEKYSEGMV